MNIIKKLISNSLWLSGKNFTFSAVQSFIIIVLIFFSLQAKSQETPKHFFSEKGFKIGVSLYSIELPESQHYKPLLMMGSFGHVLTVKEKKGKWWLMFEPQLNPVFLDNQLEEAEFGINLAIRYNYHVSENFSFYGQLGSGPHFITISTDRQAHGFIFSDNLEFGLRNKISGRWMINTGFRLRHISNASIMTPNRGMNNLFILFGFIKNINQ